MIRRTIALLHPRYAFRDSGTGMFVTKLYALLHPGTTEQERLP